MSWATLPHADSTAAMESVRVPSCQHTPLVNKSLRKKRGEIHTMSKRTASTWKETGVMVDMSEDEWCMRCGCRKDDEEV